MKETLHAVTVKIGLVRPESPEGERKLLSSGGQPLDCCSRQQKKPARRRF